MALRFFYLGFIFFITLTGLISFKSHAAASILIWPIDPVLLPDQKATELWMENKGKTPATLQIRVIGWEQKNGDEQYIHPQSEVLASPPITRVEPGKKQLIRIIRTIPVPSGKELAYRILIDEIPSPANPEEGAMKIAVQMRYSLPLFIYGNNSFPKSVNTLQILNNQLSWRWVKQGKTSAIEIRNNGAIHVKLTDVTLDGQKLGDGLLGYVLAQSSKIFPLPATISNPRLLQAKVNAEKTLWKAEISQ